MIKALENHYRIADRASFASCTEYLKFITINSIPPKPFREIAEPWQWAISSRIIPAIEFSAQVRKEYNGPMKFLLVLPKGHDKTSMLGRVLNWAMAYSHTHLTAYAAAKDREQAGLLADSMLIEANLNPWLKKHLQFKNWKVHGRNDSRLHIMAADAEGAAGIRGDLLVMDELSQWQKKDFFDQLMIGYHKRVDLQKRSRCTLLIITNAGVKGSWQHDFLQEAKGMMYEGKGWYVYEAPEGHPLASWMTREKIDEQRRMVPVPMGKMLLDNIWIDPNEDNQFVNFDQIIGCVDNEFYLQNPDRKGECFAAIDYGPVKDRTVMTVVRRVDNILVIEEMKVLQGSKENHVLISDVEDWIMNIRIKYPLELLVIDKYQMESTIQKFRGMIPIEVFEPRGSGSGNYAMAENLRSIIVNRQIKWSSDCGSLIVKDKYGKEITQTLSDELQTVGVKMTPGGYRIFNPPGSHDDRVVSLGMASLFGMRSIQKKRLWFGQEDLWF